MHKLPPHGKTMLWQVCYSFLINILWNPYHTVCAMKCFQNLKEHFQPVILPYWINHHLALLQPISLYNYTLHISRCKANLGKQRSHLSNIRGS